MSAYATINEAYGKDFNKKKKKDKKGKKQSACHYYAQRYSKTQSQKDAEPFNLGGLDSKNSLIPFFNLFVFQKSKVSKFFNSFKHSNDNLGAISLNVLFFCEKVCVSSLIVSIG